MPWMRKEITRFLNETLFVGCCNFLWVGLGWPSKLAGPTGHTLCCEWLGFACLLLMLMGSSNWVCVTIGPIKATKKQTTSQQSNWLFRVWIYKWRETMTVRLRGNWKLQSVLQRREVTNQKRALLPLDLKRYWEVVIHGGSTSSLKSLICQAM